MSLAMFPAELERPMRDGYQFSRGEGRMLNAEDAPVLRVTRRWSAVADSVRMTFDWTVSQVAVFDRFYDDMTGKGALPFLMPNWEVDGLSMLTADGTPVLKGDGTPVLIAATWKVMFGRGLPSRTVVGVRRRVSFEIAVLP